MRLHQIKKISLLFFTTCAAMVMLTSCDKEPIGPTGPDPLGPGDYMSFADFRALYPGSGTFVFPTGTKRIRGRVISKNTNEAAGSYRLQDESGAGIYFYSVIGSPVYPLDAILEINPNDGGKFTLYNGDLELMSVPQANVTQVSGAITITPRVATIADIITNRNTWASSLVKINNVTGISVASSNGTGTTYNVTDASGTLSMFVRTTSGITVNTSGTSITGYVSIYNTTTQIGIRTAADIQ
ncbi:MAG: hypothetical protein BWZ05_00023 [Bacteroidetes bacterium ADurb.BinA245]|jgi:hypothetical protein|nr:hypothetical protein [Chitinophagaceae bacterium]OPZ19447.1 MAG: hypothetical protein BWZ05_00023 [Bacteroidetes bacterium ADurb.BinA245]HNF38766.1 DUF5689 domain-containing protein [Chitinophagaceae bacterium]